MLLSAFFVFPCALYYNTSRAITDMHLQMEDSDRHVPIKSIEELPE